MSDFIRRNDSKSKDSVLIATFNTPLHPFPGIFISPDLSCIAALETPSSLDERFGGVNKLKMYDVSTGRCLASAEGVLHSLSTLDGSKVADILSEVDEVSGELWFTPDGREIWSFDDRHFPRDRWEIIEDSELGSSNLRYLTNAGPSPGRHPWRSSRGYEVTNDGWIMSPTQERLLWLPHHWRSHERYRRWTGRFLGLSHYGLLEVVILQFFD